MAGPLGSGELAAVPHLEVDCPLFKLQAGDFTPADEQLVWAGLAALRPSNEVRVRVLEQHNREVFPCRVPGLTCAWGTVGLSARGTVARLKACPQPPRAPRLQAASLVDMFSKAIRQLAAAKAKAAGRVLDAGGGSGARVSASGGGGGFNYIHLRLENDWVEHCARWESIHDGIVRDNCYNHTEDVASRLALFGFSNRCGQAGGDRRMRVRCLRTRMALETRQGPNRPESCFSPLLKLSSFHWCRLATPQHAAVCGKLLEGCGAAAPRAGKQEWRIHAQDRVQLPKSATRSAPLQSSGPALHVSCTT